MRPPVNTTTAPATPATPVATPAATQSSTAATATPAAPASLPRPPIALRTQLPQAHLEPDILMDYGERGAGDSDEPSVEVVKTIRASPPPVLERTSTQYTQVAYAPGSDEYWASAAASYKQGLLDACKEFDVAPPPDSWTSWVTPITSVALALRHTQLIYRFPPSASSSIPSSLTGGICADMQTTWLALVSDIRTTFTRMGLGEGVPAVLPRLHDIAATSVVLREIVTAASTIHSTYPMWIGSEDSPIPIGTLAQAILRAAIRMNAYYEMAVEAKLRTCPLDVHDHGTIASTYMEFTMWEEWRKSASYLGI